MSNFYTEYAVLRQAIVDLIGRDSADIGAQDALRIRSWFDARLRYAWTFTSWPELSLVEKRFLREVYSSAESVAYGTERYFHPTLKYYHAIRSGGFSAQDPATLSGSAYVTNSAYWAESKTSYTATRGEYSASAAYSVGDVVFYPVDGEYYHCHTASTGNAPTSTTYWGKLVLFLSYIDKGQTGQTELGDVMRVTDKDPRSFWDASDYLYAEAENRIYLPGNVPSYVYVSFRKTCPVIRGSDYSASSTYLAGSQVYWASGSTYPGDFYDVVTTTTPGDTPISAPTKFSKVNIPARFRNYLKHAVASDFLRATGQNEKALTEQRLALEYLGDERAIVEGQINGAQAGFTVGAR